MNEFKLFVIGPRSGNPDDWSGWDEPCFVMARNEAEAEALTDTGNTAYEVMVKEPCIIWVSGEPNHGDDT